MIISLTDDFINDITNSRNKKYQKVIQSKILPVTALSGVVVARSPGMVAMSLSILTALLPVLLSVAAQLSMRGASLVGHSVPETHNSSPDYDRPAALFGSGVTTHVTASARKSFVRSRQLQDALQITFREIVDGPLSDRTVTLLVDAEVEEVIHIDQLLAGVSTPLSLLRTSNKREGYNTIQEGDSHLTSQDEVDDLKVEQHNDTQDKRHNKLILSSSK